MRISVVLVLISSYSFTLSLFGVRFPFALRSPVFAAVMGRPPLLTVVGRDGARPSRFASKANEGERLRTSCERLAND